MLASSGVRVTLAVVALMAVLSVLFYFARGSSQLWSGLLLGGTLCLLLAMGVRVAFSMAVTGMLGSTSCSQ